MPIPLRSLWLSLLASVSWLAPSASAVTIDWVDVGDPGNACDTQSQGCFGSVASRYRIAATEVTNAQYAEFLNAVAATDSHALYNTSMANAGAGFGGIDRSGSAGSFGYTAVAGRESMPVNYVSFWDALRFANWLHNGQPTGAQGAATTEDGAYTITAQGMADNTIARNPGATIFLTSEDEWYKAAYYDALSASYLDYPAGSNTQTVCADPGATPNTANCGNSLGNLTAVGSYPGAASPAGTYDQGGNVWEWNQAILFDDFRGLRGGSFNHDPGNLAASIQSLTTPDAESSIYGFRVASIPEPGTALLLASGLTGLALRRRRTRRPGIAGVTREFLPFSRS